MLTGRAMYVWDLVKSLKGGAPADMVLQAQRAKLSSLWVKIGDGTTRYANIVDATADELKDLVAQCAAKNITVFGYHVPHCATLAAVDAEVTFVADTVRDFQLAGVVIDNEDGSSYFQGNSNCATAYGQKLQAAMRSVNKLMVMSSNDIISYHAGAHASQIGAFIDVNAPQVYYGGSPSVNSRLNWAISENQSIAAPFFPVGAAFVSAPGASDGGFSDPKVCGVWTGIFIGLVSTLHQKDPAKYPGYGFWNWQEAPPEVWETLYTTPVFVAPQAPVRLFAALTTTTSQPSLAGILEVFDKRSNSVAITGMITPDLNIPGNQLIVVDENDFYSIPQADIADQEQLGDLTRVWVKKGTRAWRSGAIAIGGTLQLQQTVIGMEDLPEPASEDLPGGPTKASGIHIQALRALAPAAQTQTIAAAAAAYAGSCIGGDHYANNCAHFLSDAFIRAGFSELAAGQSADHFITARCGTPAKRAIRARDMWHWFQSKATQTTNTLTRNTGIWAVFQLDEAVYWGGHVLIIDTDANVWYGTGNHANWKQYCYKW